MTLRNHVATAVPVWFTSDSDWFLDDIIPFEAREEVEIGTEASGRLTSRKTLEHQESKCLYKYRIEPPRRAAGNDVTHVCHFQYVKAVHIVVRSNTFSMAL